MNYAPVKSVLAKPAHEPSKIITPAQCAEWAEQQRLRSNRIVQAHGVFDLLHPGHIRYLRAAHKRGDVLIVSVTSDRYAKKAPGRPVFHQDLRAEMLEALDCVDAVVINDAPTAIPIIKKIQPHFYVKGADYANGKDRIGEEAEHVKRLGGEVVIAGDVLFSSSELINRHMPIGDDVTRNYLDRARSLGYIELARALLERASTLKVLMIGETIYDEYVYVSPLGKPPKEFVISTRDEGRERFNGGILAAAKHAESFVATVDTFTRIEVTKTRFVERDFNRKLFEVYSMDDALALDEAAILRELKTECPRYDTVIVIDFGHGMITPAMRDTIRSHSKFLAVNAQSNSANHGFNPVTNYGADLICVDAPEARLAIQKQKAPLNECATRLLKNAPQVIITDGRRGSLARAASWETSRTIPAFADKIIDTMGAGDAFLAVTAPLATLSDDLELIAFIGNIVGGIKVGTVGHRKPVEKQTVLRYIETLLR